jgi:hypothetical protein
MKVDADLEYDPKDLLRLVEPLAIGKADTVVRSRRQMRLKPAHGQPKQVLAHSRDPPEKQIRPCNSDCLVSAAKLMSSDPRSVFS